MLQLDLSGHLAVVTGGSGQLGREICRTLARGGADVVVHYFSRGEKAEQIRDEILAMGRRSMAVKADITKEADVMAMRDAIRSELGDPDIICNNAVIQYQWMHVLEQGLDDYRSQFESCVMQNVLMAKAFVPAMIEKGWGRVIATNTECAMQCFEGQSAYVSGKRGMDGVLRVLAKEVGPHEITVNQVAPGYTISEDNPGNPEDPGEIAYTQRVPMKHRGVSQNIANAVAFLASDMASYITGLYMPVCGGNEMPRI